MVGAYVGLDLIDANKVRKVLECDGKKTLTMNIDIAAENKRPAFLQPAKGCID